jgi:tripartite-type tricarboxylate transporter receptor subunit TctC
VRNFREFMEWTKNYKGALNYGSAGHGSGGHLAAELYKMGWYGVLVPASLPKPILTRLYTEFAAIIKQPEAQSRIRSSARTRSAARRRSSGSTCSPTSPSGRRW